MDTKTLHKDPKMSSPSAMLPDRRYLAAIAANNVGVTLLERGAFLEALRTFKDAITLLQHVFPQSGGNGTPASSSDHQARVDAVMTELSKRLEASRASPTVLGHGRKTSRGKLTIHTIADFEQQQGSLAATMTTILDENDRRHEAVSTIFPVRLETLESMNADAVASAILYNDGLAHFSLGKTMEEELPGVPAQRIEERRRELVTAAYNLLKFSHNIIRNVLSIAVEKDEIEDRPVVVFFLAGMVLSSLARILLDLGYDEEATETYEKAGDVKMLVVQVEKCTECYCSIYAAKAA